MTETPLRISQSPGNARRASRDREPGPATVPGSPAPADGGITLAGLLSAVAEAVPWRWAIVAGTQRLTYAELDARVTLFARHLALAGIEPGEPVAILSYNRAEWLEAAFGALRSGAVPVNVNYRYVASELRHLLNDSGAAALVCERSLSHTVTTVRARLPALRHVVLLDDGSAPSPTDGAGSSGVNSVEYETALALAARATAPQGDPGTRGDPDARYLLYTGGTTGTPKAVVWRQADIFHAALERRRPGEPRATSPAELGERARACRARRMLVLGPLMHAAGQWNAMSMLFNGKTVVLNTERTLDPGSAIALADREDVHMLQVVGDSMARPLALRLLAEPYRCPSLTTVTSGGTPLTPAVRELWHQWRPDVALNDSYGGSETGVCGAAGEADTAGGNGARGRRFTMGPSVAVLDEDLRPLPPGSDRIGDIARTGRIPIGYHNDPAATARTFPTDPDGRRWVMSGDFGMVAPDGSIVLLGRGSAVINTGGEKVHPEEVESALKTHPDVDDTIVVGAPDDRLGQRVAAVVAPCPGRVPSDEQLREHCRGRLAGFKVPRAIHFVDRVRRTAVGKQDYRWASAVARWGR